MRYAIPSKQLALCASAACLLMAAAALAQSVEDCGHKTTQHNCTGGQTRIRMDIQEAVAISEIKSTASPVTLSLLFTDERKNSTCTRVNETVNWNHSYTNDYAVTMALANGASIEVNVGTPEWFPIVAAAKGKAESSITITTATTRTETFSVGGSSSFSLRCQWHKVEVFHKVRQGKATQDFATKVWCSVGVPPNNDAVWNQCNERTVTSICNGTTDTVVQHSDGSYNCNCPPEEGQS